MRRALIAALALTACGGSDATRVVEFAPPPSSSHETQLLTLPALGRRFVVARGQTVELPAIEPNDELLLEAQLFAPPPDALWLEPGELLVADGPQIRLPAAASGWTARFDGERVGDWTPVDPERVALPSQCPTFVTRELDADFEDRVAGFAVLGDDTALIADRHRVHRWRPDGFELVATTTRAIDRLGGTGSAFVGLDGRFVGRFDDDLRVVDVFDLGSELTDVDVAPDGSETFAIGASGTLARFADGAWEMLASTDGFEWFQDVTWVAPGEAILLSGGAFIDRWRAGVLTRETFDAALRINYVTASVRWDGIVFVVATTRAFERIFLVDGDDGWVPTSQDVDLLEDLVTLSAHPRGVLFGGSLGHYGVQGPGDGWKCSSEPVALDAVRSMTFVPPRNLLFETKGRFPSRVWVSTLTPP